MSRLNQIFQNFFIRLGSVLSVVFGGISGFFGKIFGSIGKSLGFSSEAKYFVETQTSLTDNKATTVSPTVNVPTQTADTTTSKFNNRKSRSADMDYFMDMAQKVKKK